MKNRAKGIFKISYLVIFPGLLVACFSGQVNTPTLFPTVSVFPSVTTTDLDNTTAMPTRTPRIIATRWENDPCFQRYPTVSPEMSISAPTLEDLENDRYCLILGAHGPFTLQDGEFERGKVITARIEAAEIGEIGKFGEVGAVIIRFYGGGSGVFYILYIKTIINGELVELYSAEIGDRVDIHSLEIIDGTIVVKMIDPRENRPLPHPVKVFTFAFNHITGKIGLISIVELSVTPTPSLSPSSEGTRSSS